ncbi:sigma-54-dependent transcriptional regulator [Fimbriiglobus ruber]|uniref:DNA-binding transcriptional regulator NtrC n=1 Tax=Fimbriiglobus ruber TaxID=1908690 RepID=A0A225DFF4_9BACT|nr:sigma-54 dependent transcriptional regulator [Fimbriiglobus ruber]OWK40280.1 Response regulator of zinc sigma-54-dependent two-component system [Fimbriiglobus ruber]
MPTILVVDDESSILHAFRRVFADPMYVLATASTAAEAVEAAGRVKPDVIVLDVHLSDATGLQTFHRLRAADARTPVILITGHGTSDLAIEAIKHGAFDYLTKPLELPQLRDVVDQAFKTSRLMHVPAVLGELEPIPDVADVLIGRGPGMQEVYKAIGRVASTDATVLILGETGTGKELVARAIYQHSRRAEKPFLAINSAAIPEQLLESELFGHEKGAYTGADRKRIGKFEQCSGGTVFLDEVGDMSPLIQAKVLRLLQDQTFERVGGSETVRTDVRLIAATNANLEQLTEQDQFRKDLYFRLNVFTIRLPPLRERGADVDLLTDHYVRRFARELQKPVQGLAPDGRELLQRHAWPGNVRELQSTLKKAILYSRGSVITAQDLNAALGTVAAPVPVAGSTGGFDWDHFVQQRIAAGVESLYAEAVTAMEREVLLRVLQHTHGNQVQAARILGITRGSLRNKIRALNISIGRSIWADDDQAD